MATFASGRYSKRKREQVDYNDSIDDSQFKSDSEAHSHKKRKIQRMAEANGDDNGQDDAAECSGEDAESDYGPAPPKKHKDNFSQSKHTKKATRTMKRTTPKPFPFLKLPGEVRNYIYELVLTHDHIVIEGNTRQHLRNARVSRPDDDNARLSLSPAILAVNKQTYFDAYNIMYRSKLSFVDTTAISYFAARINPKGLQQIRSVRLPLFTPASYAWSTPANFTSFVFLAQMSKLTEVQIDFTFAEELIRQPQDVARDQFVIAFPLLHAVASRKGDPEAGVDLIKLNLCNLDGTYTDEQIEKGKSDFKDGLKLEIQKERDRLRGKRYKTAKK